MNIDQLRQRFPNEQACRSFFESVMWQKGRYCPHCHAEKSWLLKGSSARVGLYQCSQCGRQFTVTTKMPMHSTKLPLWKWLLAMYFMVNSSKGVSSMFLARWVGISQKSAWKLAHAIRQMMAPDSVCSRRFRASWNWMKNTSVASRGLRMVSRINAAKAPRSNECWWALKEAARSGLFRSETTASPA